MGVGILMMSIVGLLLIEVIAIFTQANSNDSLSLYKSYLIYLIFNVFLLLDKIIHWLR